MYYLLIYCNRKTLLADKRDTTYKTIEQTRVIIRQQGAESSSIVWETCVGLLGWIWLSLFTDRIELGNIWSTLCCNAAPLSLVSSWSRGVRSSQKSCS